MVAEGTDWNMVIGIAVIVVVVGFVVQRSVVVTRRVAGECERRIAEELARLGLELEGVRGGATLVPLTNKYNIATPVKYTVTYRDKRGMRQEAAFKFKLRIGTLGFRVDYESLKTEPPLDEVAAPASAAPADGPPT